MKVEDLLIRNSDLIVRMLSGFLICLNLALMSAFLFPGIDFKSLYQDFTVLAISSFLCIAFFLGSLCLSLTSWAFALIEDMIDKKLTLRLFLESKLDGDDIIQCICRHHKVYILDEYYWKHHANIREIFIDQIPEPRRISERVTYTRILSFSMYIPCILFAINAYTLGSIHLHIAPVMYIFAVYNIWTAYIWKHEEAYHIFLNYYKYRLYKESSEKLQKNDKGTFS